MKFKPSLKPGELIVELKRNDALPVVEAAGVTRRPSPFSLKRILVPIDFSERSRQALRYAVPFAREFDASIVVLHVAQASYPGLEAIDVSLAKFEAELREKAKIELSVVAAQEIGDEIPSQAIVRTGRAFEEIIHVAETMDIDLIILSTQGRSGLAHFLLGSTAEKVVRHAPCPVFIVREKEREFITPRKSTGERKANEAKNSIPSLLLPA